MADGPMSTPRRPCPRSMAAPTMVTGGRERAGALLSGWLTAPGRYRIAAGPLRLLAGELVAQCAAGIGLQEVAQGDAHEHRLAVGQRLLAAAQRGGRVQLAAGHARDLG